jgi:hypothetical protein
MDWRLRGPPKGKEAEGERDEEGGRKRRGRKGRRIEEGGRQGTTYKSHKESSPA